LGLAILSVHDPEALRRAVANDDIAALCLVPGVGKKTAARLLVELKSRLDVPERDTGPVIVDGGRGSSLPDSRSDVRAALEGLGYGSDEIRTALNDLPDASESSELLREALRRLASGV